jgi:hypothetical protein
VLRGQQSVGDTFRRRSAFRQGIEGATNQKEEKEMLSRRRQLAMVLRLMGVKGMMKEWWLNYVGVSRPGTPAWLSATPQLCVRACLGRGARSVQCAQQMTKISLSRADADAGGHRDPSRQQHSLPLPAITTSSPCALRSLSSRLHAVDSLLSSCATTYLYHYLYHYLYPISAMHIR